jgi:hypothetical protein
MSEVVRYRPGWRQLPWFSVLAVVALAGTHEGPVTAVDAALFAAFAVTVGCVIAAVRIGSGADLRPDALVIHGARSRVVLWSSVSAVYASSILGTKVVYVVVDGVPKMLRAPMHSPFLAPDADFDAKLATITEYWVARRGPAWTPPSWVPELAVGRTAT